MTIITASQPALSARDALSQEWLDKNPQTPDEILDFYRNAEHLAEDLEEFHALPLRQSWTDILVRLAKNTDAHLVVDIGSGCGHDLRALRAAGIHAEGVEPNDWLRDRCFLDGLTLYRDVDDAPIEDADILACVDVLEHIPDPETWLGRIASRAHVGAFLLEASAVWDITTPLHLPSNRGWAPGRVLQQHGWDRIATHDRLSGWQRFQKEAIHQTYLVVCVGQSLHVKTHQAILSTLRSDDGNYDWVPSEATEAGLLRARSNWASKWYRDTCGDVFLMVDSDIGFTARDAMHIVDLAREKRSIVCAAYPTKDGKTLTIKPLEDEGTLEFGPDLPPREIRWGATGFMAIHRDVLDAMIPTLPLCGAQVPSSLWPIFNLDFTREALADGTESWQLLGEDFTVCERARNLGFQVWLDPTIMVDHWSGLMPINYRNMQQAAALIREGD